MTFAAPVMEGRTRGDRKRHRVEVVPKELKGRATVGGEKLPRVSMVPAAEGEEGEKKAAMLDYAVHAMKPCVFDELLAHGGAVKGKTFLVRNQTRNMGGCDDKVRPCGEPFWLEPSWLERRGRCRVPTD
jgi:hypothetical protein